MISFTFNKWEREWFYSPDNGRTLWTIQKSWNPKTHDLDGYEVVVQTLMNPDSYSDETPIFNCRYLNEAKNFIRLCFHSQETRKGIAFKYRYFTGYGAETREI